MWTARLRALQALILINIGRHVEAEASARQAEAEGTRADDRLAVGYALQVQCLTLFYRSEDQATSVDQAMLDVIERALPVLGTEPEVNHLRLLLLGNRAALLASLGRHTDADRAFAEAQQLADRGGAPPLRAATINVQAASHAFFCGRWADAEAELEAAADVLPPGAPHERLWLHGVGALIAVHRDDRAELNRHQQAVKSMEITGDNLRYLAEYLLVARALTAERDGQPAEALRQLLSLFDPSSILDFSKLTDSSSYLWLPDLVRLAVASGDEDSARAAADVCEAEARRQPTPFHQAVAAHCLGLLASDPAKLLASADAYEAACLPLYQGQALENAAVLLAGQPDSAAARSAYSKAVGIYTRLEAAWDIRRRTPDCARSVCAGV